MSKKGGRPRKPADTVRSRTIGVRVSARELEDLHTRASEMGLPVGTWLRVAGQSRQLPKPPVPPINRAVYADLGRLGNVLNQIARASHQGQVQVDSALLQKTLDELRRVRLELLGISDDLSTPRGGACR